MQIVLETVFLKAEKKGEKLETFERGSKQFVDVDAGRSRSLRRRLRVCHQSIISERAGPTAVRADRVARVLQVVTNLIDSGHLILQKTNMFSLQPTVVSKSSNPGLSLLSRGIGEEKEQHGQTKLEVCLEPEVHL